MNLAEYEQQFAEQSQQLHRQYGVNALLPEIQWNQLFPNSKLSSTHLQALETIYQSAVPLALQVFEELNFDVFSPAAYKPQGLGLFEKLADQEQQLLSLLEQEAQGLDEPTRQHIWSILLRGGAVLVFKAWLGKVKTDTAQLDTSQFDELSDLLFIKTPPFELAERLNINAYAPAEHIFLLYSNDVYLDRFNSLETAALFVDLGVYDAAFLSLRDDRVAKYLIGQGYVSQQQIDELQCALNPLNCADLNPKQNYIA